MPEYDRIIYEKKGKVAFITINRPQRLNAIDPATSQQLYAAFQDFAEDPDRWVAILTGAGERAFSSGNDLIATAEARAGAEEGRIGHGVPFGGITKGVFIPKPIIAAINGYCVAGGLEIAMACDIRIAAEHAQFGQPEPRWAIIPGAGGTQRLPRFIPMAPAMELLFLGNFIGAQEALRWGLVSRVVPLEQLIPTAEEMAATICRNGPLAIRAIKEAAWRGLQMPLDQALAVEDLYSELVYRSQDAREGPQAFAEKREPRYHGR